MSQLPLSKVKKIAKFNPDIRLISSEAVQAVGMAAELFIQEVAKQAHSQAQLNKRKTIKMDDIDACIAGVEWMEFLDGCFEGWLDTKSIQTLNEEEEEDQEEEEVDGNVAAVPNEEEQEEAADEVVGESEEEEDEIRLEKEVVGAFGSSANLFSNNTNDKSIVNTTAETTEKEKEGGIAGETGEHEQPTNKKTQHDKNPEIETTGQSSKSGSIDQSSLSLRFAQFESHDL